MSQQNKFVYPLYDTLLRDACKDAQHMLFVSPPEEAWKAAKKLRILVREPEDRKKFDQHVRLTEQLVAQIKRPRGYTTAEYITKLKEINDLYEKKAEELLDMIYGSLDANLYFKRKARESNANVTMEEFELSCSPPPECQQTSDPEAHQNP